MSSGRISQHRNYGDIMARHERDIKLKRILRAFVYVLVIAFLVLLFLIVRQIQSKKMQKSTPGVALVIKQ